MSATKSERAPPPKKTILIVDDHPVLRRGLAAVIEPEPDLTVCGAVATGAAALEAIRKSPPDLVLVDLVLAGSNGLDLIKEMKACYPGVPALVLSMHDEIVYAERSLRAGARGYITKQQLDETVLVAIRRVLAGEIYMSDKLMGQFAEKYVTGRTLATDSPLDALSDRELQVFRLIGQGQTTRQIAQTLSLSIKTIESHREHIKSKLNLESAAALVHCAIDQWIKSDRSN